LRQFEGRRNANSKREVTGDVSEDGFGEEV
jgi:hypothetical protein